jgi:SAM-dependent methyltransferase
MDAKSVVRDGYNALAAAYLEARSQDSPDVQLLYELADRLPSGAAVLDAGCGAGVPVARILSESFDVTGVDFAQAQVELARRLVPQARFLCQDMTALVFPDESFDAIVSYYAIIHIPRREHRPLLQEFNRLLKPGGLALLCLGAEDLEDDLDGFLGVPMYWSHYDAAVYRDMLAETGFEIVLERVVADVTAAEGSHFFALARKAGDPSGEKT